MFLCHSVGRTRPSLLLLLWTLQQFSRQPRSGVLARCVVSSLPLSGWKLNKFMCSVTRREVPVIWFETIYDDFGVCVIRKKIQKAEWLSGIWRGHVALESNRRQAKKSSSHRSNARQSGREFHLECLSCAFSDVSWSGSYLNNCRHLVEGSTLWFSLAEQDHKRPRVTIATIAWIIGAEIISSPSTRPRCHHGRSISLACNLGFFTYCNANNLFSYYSAINTLQSRQCFQTTHHTFLSSRHSCHLNLMTNRSSNCRRKFYFAFFHIWM